MFYRWKWNFNDPCDFFMWKKNEIMIFQVQINLFDVIKAIPMIKNYSYYFHKKKKLNVTAKLNPKYF
jgi:hypothetical protein